MVEGLSSIFSDWFILSFWKSYSSINGMFSSIIALVTIWLNSLQCDLHLQFHRMLETFQSPFFIDPHFPHAWFFPIIQTYCPCFFRKIFYQFLGWYLLSLDFDYSFRLELSRIRVNYRSFLVYLRQSFLNFYQILGKFPV